MNSLRPRIFVVSILMGFILGTALRWFWPSPLVQAATPLVCTDNYYSFIATARTPAESEGAFKDFFRPYCQVQDILSVQDELDGLRKEFLSAATACEDTTSYRSRYYALLMELYFLRHAQPLDPEVLNSRETAAIQAAQTQGLQTLKTAMKTLFVDQEERVSESDFDTLFETWSSRYADRLKGGTSCTDNPWNGLTADWQNFVDRINALDFSIDIEKKTAADLLPKFTAQGDNGDFQKFSALGQGARAFYDSVKALYDEKTAPALTPSDLAQSGEPISLENALSALQSGSFVTDTQLAGNARMARYTVLYGYGGTLAASELATLVQQMNQTLESMNTVDLPAIQDQSAQVYAKECQQ